MTDHLQPGTRYEGRPLPRPAEEVVDQGLGFDLGTLFSRRRLLGVLGLGVAGVGLAACGSGSGGSGASAGASSASTASGEIPDETAGPYPGDGSNGPDVLAQSGIVRSDIRSSFGDASGTAEGVPMTLELTVTDLVAGAPFEGVAVYVWHCDREGGYSLYSDGITGENYLRGVQIADAAGTVRFTSIFPACYTGRWPHVHVEVYPGEATITDSTNAIATSQVALPQGVCEAVYATAGYEASVASLARVGLDSDNVFGDDGGALQLGRHRQRGQRLRRLPGRRRRHLDHPHRRRALRRRRPLRRPGRRGGRRHAAVRRTGGHPAEPCARRDPAHRRADALTGRAGSVGSVA